MTDSITCRKPFQLSTCLNTALQKEWRKHTATPVAVDLVPGHDLAQACGYVVAGRLLTKQGLNAVLLVRDVEPPRIYALSVLFEAMPWEDRVMLRAYCDGLRHALPSTPSFSLATLHEFLVNPDEGRDSRGLCIGSFDWRCLPAEEEGGASMPLVSINVMHETVCGCVQLVGSIDEEDRERACATCGWRLQRERSNRFRDRLMVRMNSLGWGAERRPARDAMGTRQRRAVRLPIVRRRLDQVARRTSAEWDGRELVDAGPGLVAETDTDRRASESPSEHCGAAPAGIREEVAGQTPRSAKVRLRMLRAADHHHSFRRLLGAD